MFAFLMHLPLGSVGFELYIPTGHTHVLSVRGRCMCQLETRDASSELETSAPLGVLGELLFQNLIYEGHLRSSIRYSLLIYVTALAQVVTWNRAMDLTI